MRETIIWLHNRLDILAIISFMPVSSLAPYSLLAFAFSDFGRLLIIGLWSGCSPKCTVMVYFVTDPLIR